MIQALRLTLLELRKQLALLKSYYTNTLFTQLIYIASFVLLSGLSNIVTDNRFSDQDKLAFLIGFITWWVAGECMVAVSKTIAEDAKWGTLEQVRLSGISPTGLMFARSASFIIYFSLQAIIMASIIIIITGLSVSFSPEILLIYLITLTGALGLSFVFTGLHIVYKNVAVLSDAISFMFFFLSGVLSPLPAGTALYIVSRFLPLSAGIDLMRMMILENTPLAAALASGEFVLLIINTFVYLLAGIAVLNRGFRQAQIDGSLAHY